jgi:adenylate cyclase
VVVGAVRAEGGDVLKFIGDGMLSIFPVEVGGRGEATLHAYRALTGALATAAQMGGLRFVGCLHIGPVTYGNIGSSDRLDFTVVGPTVNLVSRLEALTKSTGNVAICSREAAALLPTGAAEVLGTFPLKGVLGEQVVFTMHQSYGHT